MGRRLQIITAVRIGHVNAVFPLSCVLLCVLKVGSVREASYDCAFKHYHESCSLSRIQILVEFGGGRVAQKVKEWLNGGGVGREEEGNKTVGGEGRHG